MGMKIVVFVEKPPTKKQEQICKALDGYFTFMVDAIHGNDMKYLKETYTNNSRFFYLSEFLSRSRVDEIDFAPDFVVNFDDSKAVSEQEWVCIERYLERIFMPSYRISPRVEETALKLMEEYLTPQLLKSPEQRQLEADQKECYEIRSKEWPEMNIMIIELEKPYCDLPYTVVIRNFREHGLQKFFTDLYFSRSWGVCRMDFAFLQKLWKHWGLDGDLTQERMDKMLHDATQRCFPTAGENMISEPELYRRPLENVIQVLGEKLNGKRTSDLDMWNERRMKKRREDEELIN